jgi:hypothetical protein
MQFPSFLATKTILKSSLRLLALPLLALSVATNTFANPALVNIQIKPTEVVISGSGFGNGPKVVLFDNFEHGSKFADLLQSQGNQNNWFSGVLPFKESDGNTAHRAKDPVQVALGKKGLAQVISVFPTAYQTALVAFSVKVPAGTTFAGAATLKTFPSMSSWKFAWLMLGSNGFQEADKFDVCIPTHPGGGNFGFIGNTGAVTWLDPLGGWWEWDNYNHMTSYIKIDKAAPSTTPIKYNFDVVNNLNHYSKAGDSSKYMASSFQQTNFTFDRINIPGWWGNGDNTNFDGLYDNMYVAVGDNALARVVITDTADYTKSHFAVPVLPSSWTDTQISLDVDVLPRTKDTYYINVIDSNGVIGTSSLKLLTSSLPVPNCPNCPKPPKPQ